MSDTSVHLVLSGRMVFEDDISLAQAAHILAYLTGQESPAGVGQEAVLDLRSETTRIVPAQPVSPSPDSPAPAPAPAPAPEPPPGPPATPRELLQSTGAKTNVEKIVAFAGYLTRNDTAETFTVNDVRQVFRRAREPLPGNLNRDVDSAIRAGFVAPAGAPGEFFLTGQAETALESGFGAVHGRPPRQRSSAHGGRGRPTPPPELESLDELPGVPEGMPAFHEVPLKRDRVLWVLAAAKAAGIDALSNRGVEWLTDRYGDGVLAKHVGVHHDALRRPGYVTRSLRDQRLRITPQGEAYLRSLRGRAG
jgi:hypothetical protein